MKILITGGLGFIGSHLVDSLAKQNHEIMSNAKKRMSFSQKRKTPEACTLRHRYLKTLHNHGKFSVSKKGTPSKKT